MYKYFLSFILFFSSTNDLYASSLKYLQIDISVGCEVVHLITIKINYVEDPVRAECLVMPTNYIDDFPIYYKIIRLSKKDAKTITKRLNNILKMEISEGSSDCKDIVSGSATIAVKAIYEGVTKRHLYYQKDNKSYCYDVKSKIWKFFKVIDSIRQGKMGKRELYVEGIQNNIDVFTENATRILNDKNKKLKKSELRSGATNALFLLNKWTPEIFEDEDPYVRIAFLSNIAAIDFEGNIPIFLKALDDSSSDVKVITLMKIKSHMKKLNAEVLKKVKEVLKRDWNVKGGEFGLVFEYPVRKFCEDVINEFEKKDGKDNRKCPNE